MGDLDGVVDAVRRHRRAIAIDLLVVTALVGGVWWVIDAHNFDTWLYYVALFGAVVVYATLVPFGVTDGGSESDDAGPPDDTFG